MRTLLFVLAALWSQSGAAIERIDFSADRVDAPAHAALEGLHATLSIGAHGDTALSATLATLQLADPRQQLGAIRLQCASLVLREPDWRCDDATVQLGNTPLGVTHARVSAHLDSATGRVDAAISEWPIAGGTLGLRAQLDGSRWQVTDAAAQFALPALAGWLKPWWQGPPDLHYTGNATLQFSASGNGAAVEATTLLLQLRDFNLQNDAGNLVAEKLDTDLHVELREQRRELDGELQLSSSKGQALAGPVFVDLAAHPLQLHSPLHVAAGIVELAQLVLNSRELIDASGSARVRVTPRPQLLELRADVTRLQFPATYTSLLQLALATTNFGNLESSGQASGHIELRNNRLTAIDLQSDGLEFGDHSKGYALRGLAGEFHWRPLPATSTGGAATGDLAKAVAASTIRWQQFEAFGLAGGSATLDLRALGDTLELIRPTSIPIFDGALAVQRFDAHGLGSQDVTLGFDGRIEQIGMPQLSRAFGWPEMQGTISGRLPGLEYRAGTLSVGGDVAAQVFDGTVTASDLQLRNAFGSFPRFSGNFSARNLDLERVTRAFPIGSITGRLDAEVRGLELFNWSPIAFDAHLYSTAGDKTRHRISQRAVNSLASLGGGGGGVMAALQSGFLRFFDDFGYDRIGLHCQLRNDVCLMDGIARAGGGFYLVKGGGLPRLDVIGNSGRIAWSQLVSQIGAAVDNGKVEVR